MTAMDETMPIPVGDSALMTAISKAELDMQITTARAYPRSVKKFRDECMQMATLTEDIATGCFYALPRDGKTIEGPSARLAEIVASAWGNCRAGARIVSEDGEFVTAQGVFHDLERNVAITYEVRRRITDRSGRRYKPDMIGVTGNAACSIALRNAVFKGVPKAFWSDIYEAARKASVGDIKTLANRRADALAFLQKMGATEPQVLAVLGRAGVEDITLDDLATLKGLATAIKEGETTVEQAFAPRSDDKPEAKGVAGLASKLAPKTPPPAQEAPPVREYSSSDMIGDALADVHKAATLDELRAVKARVVATKFVPDARKRIDEAMGQKAHELDSERAAIAGEGAP